MDVPLTMVAVAGAAATLAAAVEMLRGRPFVGRASVPVLLGRLLVVAGAAASPVGRLLGDHLLFGEVLGAVLVTAGVGQFVGHWARENARARAAGLEAVGSARQLAADRTRPWTRPAGGVTGDANRR